MPVLAIRDVHDKATVLEQAGPAEPAFLAIPQGFPKVAIKNRFFWMNAAMDLFFDVPRPQKNSASGSESTLGIPCCFDQIPCS